MKAQSAWSLHMYFIKSCQHNVSKSRLPLDSFMEWELSKELDGGLHDIHI